MVLPLVAAAIFALIQYLGANKTVDPETGKVIRGALSDAQGEALNAALVAGVERRRKAYLCPVCRRWHLSSA